MGSGTWDTNVYAASSALRASTGTSAFAYSATTRATQPQSSWKTHDTLDPNGVDVREARDSDDHPLSLPVAVLFDVTGSMGVLPEIMQQSLPELLEDLQLQAYIEHPQILFGAIGDATSDRCPLQIGQFESDNRIEDHLGNILLEGNGGGQNTESYELAMYFMARHTVTDSWEKRQHKGYLFITGDEHPYPVVKAREVRAVIGDDIAENISVEAIISELQEKWHVYFIIPMETSYSRNADLKADWVRLLGQNVLELDDAKDLAKLVAKTVGDAEEVLNP